jgi:hypothetical protein
MVTQLVRRRDNKADLFCIAGDTNFKSFEEARSITAEAQGFSFHACIPQMRGGRLHLLMRQHG